MKLILDLEERKTLTIQGGRFYYEKGEAKINVRMIAGGDARDFDLHPGQGFVCKENDRFFALEITNLGAAQTIEFEVSDREKFDNRATIAATGDALPVSLKAGEAVEIKNEAGQVLDVRLTYSVSRALAKKSIPAGVATKLLDLDVSRAKAALYFVGDCFLGVNNTVSDATGFPITAGSDWVDENSAELWVFSVAANTVHVIEDRR